jgi:deoxyribonuclease V
MERPHKHWLFPESIPAAQAAQKEMGEKVCLNDVLDLKTIRYLAGVDISNTPFDPKQMIYAAIVILAYPSLDIVEVAETSARQEFPYIPGLLGFREVPALVKAYQKLSIRPDLIMVDGHGVSHPRGLGVASHLGVLLNVPTIGVAKSILVGKPAHPMAAEKGSTSSLQFKGAEIGLLLRSKKNCNPLIISPGHKISLETSLIMVNNCLQKYRLPEPTRQAHIHANACRIRCQSEFIDTPTET